MSNFALKTDGRPLADVQRELSKHLPGLDARLWPYSANQAVIGAPLVRALEIDYADPGAGPLLKSLGVVSIRAISDEDTAALLSGRDVDALAVRPLLPQSKAKAAGLDWHLAMVNAPAAWALLGGPDHIAWGNVRVAHIDTGYTRHPVFGFEGASWVDTARAQTFSKPLPAGEASMFENEPGGGVDNLQGFSGGHGTRIGSAICGHAPAATGGVFYGVAPKVPLLPLRITDSAWINHVQREFKQAMDYAIDTVGVGVVNVSLGVFLGAVVKDMRRAINKAYENGVIVVCAAGNHVNSVVAPACLGRTVAVAGVTHERKPWSGSSYGPEVDFSAPGADIRRGNTTRTGVYEYGGGGDGTSYATAITSGAAALWLLHRKADIAARYTQPWQRVAAFTRLARDTAVPPPGWQNGAFGTGILDIEALMRAALPAAADLKQEAPA